MSLRVSSTAPGPSGLAQPGDGQRLAASLRASRITVLYGAAGSGKSALLKNDVLPMLHRRATDMALPHTLAPRVVIPFADRRRGPAAFGGGRHAEVAVLFDDWSIAPLSPLQQLQQLPHLSPLSRLLGQVHEAMGIAAPEADLAHLSLAGSMAALNMKFGARFLIVLDQFEEALAAAEQAPGAREFLDQLVQTLNRPLLPVNVLIAVREEASGLLDGLRSMVPGFDEHAMQLGTPPEARAPLRRVPLAPSEAPRAAASRSAVPPSAGVPRGTAPSTPPAPEPAADAPAAPDRIPAQFTEEWYQSIGAILRRAAVTARHDGMPPLEATVPPPTARAPAGIAAASLEREVPLAPSLAPDVPPATASTASESSIDDNDDEAEAAAAAPPPPIEFSIDWRQIGASDERAEPPLPAAEPMRGAITASPRHEQEKEDKQEAEDDDVPLPAVGPALPAVRASRLPRKTELAVWVIAGVVFVGYGAWVAFGPRGETAELASAASPNPTAPAMTAAPVPVPAPAPTPPALATIPAPAPAPIVAIAKPPPATPTITARPRVDIDAMPRPLSELAGTIALALPAAARVAPAASWPAGFAALPGAPQFAVARYDALQAAHRQAVAAPLQVIAPLYIEPVYFVARADSPMTYIHDIQGAAINAGPAESGRAVTAGAIYRRLFGKPLPDRGGVASGADAAVSQLLAGQGVDVVVLTGSQPSAWLAGLPPETAKAVKVLRLDKSNAADQRVLQAYLPMTLRAGLAQGTPSLAVMSFLVTADAQASVAGVNALCAALPALQQTGDPMWRELQPGLQLEAGWPASLAAQQAWRNCAPRSS